MGLVQPVATNPTFLSSSTKSDVPSDESHDGDHHRNQSDGDFDHDREDGSSVDDEEEYDEGHVDIEFYRKVVSWFVLDDYVDENDSLIPDEEKDMIRTMLALEQARNDFIDGKMKVRLPTPDPPAVEESNDVILISSPEHQDEDSNGIPSKSNSNGSSPRSKQTEHGFDNEKAKKVPEKEKYDLEDFPVSTNGACPYCHSNNVVYIILKESENEKRQLPDLLVRLVGDGKAEVNVKGDDEWPSFQCRNCTYGFNLDWNKTNLEKIFYPTHHDKSKSTWSRPLANSTVTSTTSLTLNRPIGVGQHPMAPGIPSAMASQQHVPHLSTLPRVPFPQPFIPPLMWGPMIPPPMPFPGMIPHPLPMQPAPMYPMASVSQQPVRSVIPQGAVPVPSSQVPITVASQLLAAAQKAKESQPAPTPQQPLSQPTNVASANISEDEKIKAVMAQQATVSGIDPAQYEKAKVPHPMYVCYRCGGKGHFVRQCPTHEVPITVASKFLAVAQKKQALVTQAVAGAKQKAQELQEKHQQTVSHTSTPGYFSQRTWDPPPPPPPPEAGSESKTLSTTDVSKVPATVASEHIVSHTSTPGYYSQRTWDPPPPPTTDVDKANDVTIDLTKDDKVGNAEEKTATIDLTNEAESHPIEDDVKTDQSADCVNQPLAGERNNSLPVKENNKALTDLEQNPNGSDKDTLMEDLTVNDEREDLSKTNYRKRALEKEENNEDNDVIKLPKIEKEDDVNIVEHSLALSTEQQTLISNYNKRKATPTLDPLQNLEHLLDDASSEISLSPGDLVHGTGTNISKVLAAEPTSGSTSPFTDSLFNMVTEDVVKEIENDVDISKVKLENVDSVPIKKSRNEAKDVAGKDLKTSKLKTENIDFVPKKEPQSEAMVAKQQKQQPKKVVYVSLEDDESSSLDEKESDEENITIGKEKEDVVKEALQRTTRKSAARAAKRLNVSNFF
uniref:CCHC-type domain-containing protein n=1 Tax=Clytia hemisphaerica TaxID=252671 RepID=A0A7M5WJM3_9CNID